MEQYSAPCSSIRDWICACSWEYSSGSAGGAYRSSTAFSVDNNGVTELAPVVMLYKPHITEAVRAAIARGIRRGSHVLKALSVGAKACSGGRLYLYALAAAGQPGVERVIGKLRDEIERGMKLMGAKDVAALGRGNLRWR